DGGAGPHRDHRRMRMPPFCRARRGCRKARRRPDRRRVRRHLRRDQGLGLRPAGPDSPGIREDANGPEKGDSREQYSKHDQGEEAQPSVVGPLEVEPELSGGEHLLAREVGSEPDELERGPGEDRERNRPQQTLGPRFWGDLVEPVPDQAKSSEPAEIHEELGPQGIPAPPEDQPHHDSQDEEAERDAGERVEDGFHHGQCQGQSELYALPFGGAQPAVGTTPYSARMTSAGSTRLAPRAGSQLAAAATASIITEAPT